MLRQTLLIAAFSTLASATCFAGTSQNSLTDNRFYITPGFYGLNPDNDRINEDVVVGYSFAAGKGLSEHLSAELEYWREQAELRSKGLAINLLYSLQASEKISFNGIAGLGLRQADTTHPVTAVNERNRDPYLDLGIGINHQLNPHGIQTGLKLFHRYQQYGFSDQSSERANEWLAKFSVKIPLGDNPRNSFAYENASDSDNDGITNEYDQCPHTAVGDKVDSHGCRLERSDTIKQQHITACRYAVVHGTKCLPLSSEVISFDSHRATLRTDSANALDRISSILIKHSSFQVQVRGFANDSDSESFNSGLAARRANSVRTALIHLGANQARIHIVPGNTAEGIGGADRGDERQALIEFIK